MILFWFLASLKSLQSISYSETSMETSITTFLQERLMTAVTPVMKKTSDKPILPPSQLISRTSDWSVMNSSPGATEDFRVEQGCSVRGPRTLSCGPPTLFKNSELHYAYPLFYGWKHLDDFLRGKIIRRLECGRTQLEVSEELGIAQSVISRLWQRFEDGGGNASRCYSTDRPRDTTPNEDQYLAVTAKRNRRSTASDLSLSSLQLPVRQFQGRPCTDA
ncbi:uncharacterized protein TNCV_4289651 [Trichonephila clavipes]|nr:uncharacterized protein TNCV_4289651 [Trichonephila clavipes]